MRARGNYGYLESLGGQWGGGGGGGGESATACMHAWHKYEVRTQHCHQDKSFLPSSGIFRTKLVFMLHIARFHFTLERNYLFTGVASTLPSQLAGCGALRGFKK